MGLWRQDHICLGFQTSFAPFLSGAQKVKLQSAAKGGRQKEFDRFSFIFGHCVVNVSDASVIVCHFFATLLLPHSFCGGVKIGSHLNLCSKSQTAAFSIRGFTSLGIPAVPHCQQMFNSGLRIEFEASIFSSQGFRHLCFVNRLSVRTGFAANRDRSELNLDRSLRFTPKLQSQ